jgi:hypothetical protein
MSAGDTTAATATIKLATANPAGPAGALVYASPEATVLVTFFHVQSRADILRVSAPGQISLQEITQNQWAQPTGGNISSWYFFDDSTPQNKNVKWGTSNADTAAAVVPLTTGGVVTAASSLSSASSAGPTIASSVPISTTLAPSADPNASTGTVVPGATHTSGAAPPPAGRQSDGISSGTVAGAAIGCFIAGLLLAGLIFWFCGRKRRPSRARDYEASSAALMPHEKGFQTAAIPLGSTSPATSPVSDALPLPLEDKAITGEISKISNSIKNHIQSYYQTGRVSAGLIDMDDIHAIGSNQPISAGTLSTLLGNSATREIALRFCIAWIVCSRMQSTGDSKSTLLPMEVAGCYHKIANEHKNSSGKLMPPTIVYTAKSLAAQVSIMVARWRVMTAELMHASYTRNAFSRSDSRSGSVQAAANALDNILRPFADSRMDNGERRQNLEEILKRSALFAFTMFSQPSTWDFDWQQEGAFKSGELCIFPSLVQLSDESGQPLSPPRPFSEAVVRRLDER